MMFMKIWKAKILKSNNELRQMNIALNRWRGGFHNQIRFSKSAANSADFAFLRYNGIITFKEMIP